MDEPTIEELQQRVQTLTDERDSLAAKVGGLDVSVARLNEKIDALETERDESREILGEHKAEVKWLREVLRNIVKDKRALTRTVHSLVYEYGMASGRVTQPSSPLGTRLTPDGVVWDEPSKMSFEVEYSMARMTRLDRTDKKP